MQAIGRFFNLPRKVKLKFIVSLVTPGAQLAIDEDQRRGFIFGGLTVRVFMIGAVENNLVLLTIGRKRLVKLWSSHKFSNFRKTVAHFQIGDFLLVNALLFLPARMAIKVAYPICVSPFIG